MSKIEKTFAGGTPLTADELNQMAAAINDNDERIASLRDKTNTKLTELGQNFEDVHFDKYYNISYNEADKEGYYLTPYLPFGGGSFDIDAGIVDANIRIVAYDSNYNRINTWNASSSSTISRSGLDSSYAYIRMAFKYDSGGSVLFNGGVAWKNINGFKEHYPARKATTDTALESLYSFVSTLATKGARFGGLVSNNESPIEASPIHKVFYIAISDGVYQNFGGIKCEIGDIITNLTEGGVFSSWITPYDRKFALDTDINALKALIDDNASIRSTVLKEIISGSMPTLINKDISYGYRVKTDGTIEQVASSVNWYATPYIPVTIGTLVWNVSEVNTNFALALYNENKECINSFVSNAETRTTIIKSPGYIRVSFKLDSGGSVTLDGITIWDNINNIKDNTIVIRKDINDFITASEANVIVQEAMEQFNVTQAVSDWLDAHPEATTTVQDGSISVQKLDSELAKKANNIKTNDGNDSYGRYATVIGYHTYNNTGTGDKNVVIGPENMMFATSATKDIAIGYHALYREEDGQQNVCIGNEAGDNVAHGGYNTAVGANALRLQSAPSIGEPRSAEGNTAIGYNAMFKCYGDGNTILGSHALEGGVYDANVNNNLAIGQGAGCHIPDGTNNKFFLHNLYQDSYTKEITKGMMYGEFNTDTSLQMLTLNVGVFILPYLPTTDPMVAGQIWNDNGVLKISSGS